MKTFNPDIVDKGFRDALKAVLSKAEKEITIIEGLYNLHFYHDVRILMQSVFREKEISCKVYLAEEDWGLANKLLLNNLNRTQVFLGSKKADKQYIICDNQFFVQVSPYEAGTYDNKQGKYESENPEKGREYLNQNQVLDLFDRLINQEGIEKITEPNMVLDPLYRAATEKD